MDSEKVIQDLNQRFAKPLPEFGAMRNGNLKTSWMKLSCVMRS